MEAPTEPAPQPPEQIGHRPPLAHAPGRLLPRPALRVLGALVFASACCVGMIVLRCYYVGRRDQLFIIWNLVLAWVPLASSYAVYRMHTGRTRRYVLFPFCVLTWFFFFPNAPYITTDFVHVYTSIEVILWMDILSIASFAWVGLCLGFCSLYLMQEVVGHRLGRMVGWLFVLVMLAAASAGTYVGRFLRWNSWDVLHHPFLLFADLSTRLSFSRATQFFLLLMFVFLLLSYLVLFALTHLREARRP